MIAPYPRASLLAHMADEPHPSCGIEAHPFRFGPASVEGPEVDDYGCVALDPFDEAGAKLTGGDLSFADVFPMHYALSEADWV